MNRLCFAIIIQCIAVCTTGQNLSLSISDLGKWPLVENPKISNDGKYVIYTYKQDENRSIIIKSTDGSWEKWIADANTNSAVITANSQFVIVNKKDSLIIISLTKKQDENIVGVQSYRTPQEGRGEWLAYQLSNAERTLVVRNLITEKESRYSFVSEYLFSKDGNVLLLKREQGKDNQSVELLYSSANRLNIVWQGHKCGKFCFDETGNLLAFIGENKTNNAQNAVWYYSKGMDSAVVIVDKKSEGVDNSLFIRNDELYFNKDGSKIFFYLEPYVPPKPKLGYVSVDVWSWNDAKLQSQQLNDSKWPTRYLSVAAWLSQNKISKKVIQLEREEGDRVNYPVQNYKAAFVLMEHRVGSLSEDYWNHASFVSIYLINTSNGTKKLLKRNNKTANALLWISPDERLFVDYDIENENYFSYDIVKGFRRNLTEAITVPLNKVQSDYPDSKRYPCGFAGWARDNNSFFIYDQYDIWQINALAKRNPICITNGYGRRNKIIFRFNDITSPSEVNSTGVVVNGFNTANKNDGFYRINLNKQQNPELLYSGPFLYLNYDISVKADQLSPLKAKYDSTYLISQQSATESPNYFVTKDFRHYKHITNVPSPKQYFNWYSTELVTWKTFDGSQSQGVLYKPNNFDSSKKYPVVFCFYETMSQNLNAFIRPATSNGPLNIPYFVSNGYLVFTPDIHYTIGQVGNSIYNSVVSAAKYLSKIPWVDSKKMGIQGHSFGGYEVNYLITHTDIFAAAVSASGASDVISNNFGLYDDNSAQFKSEVGQYRIGATIWERPHLYIENSPILNAHKIVTPLLSMNNRQDVQVRNSQGIEMFTALRRLGKRVWMLQYDNGDHTVDGKDAEDFTIRVKQFFDHYLKDSACPRWMLYSIAAKDKGVVDGLDLIKEKDPKTGKWLTPKEGGLLTDEEKKKVEALKHRKPVTVTIE
jgi:dipeptidyl aminopeptidase/acylaminoacyl peptidase